MLIKEARLSIYPYQDDADAMINSSLGYELSVLRIYAEPLLYGIDSNSPQYPEAMRLINLLRNFLPITSESRTKRLNFKENSLVVVFLKNKERI